MTTRGHDAAVVAIGDPATLCEGISCERAELLRRPGGPVRLPMEGIELHVREVHYLCERPGKRGLANATGANYDHTRHLAHAIELHIGIYYQKCETRE